jgi:hypothetical protein
VASVCPCCGYRAVRAALCEVCAWEDRDPYQRSRYDRPSLLEAQRTFARSETSDPALRAFTRPPRAEEARPAWWTTFDDARGVLAELVERAFAGVQLDGGVSLAEAELIDDHALASRTELDRPPRGYGEGPPWEELTTAGLDRFPWGNFAFQDARGIRYHLPAFMRAHLRGPKPPRAIDSLLFILQSGHQLDALERLLAPPQRHAVARYLAWVALDETYDAIGASRAFRGRWGAHLDPEQLAHVAHVAQVLQLLR